MKKYSDFESLSKDQAYWERNQLVAALSKIYPSWLELHPLEDKEWDNDWRTIVFIEIPVRTRNPIGPDNIKTMQLSWHIHDSEVDSFNHLEWGSVKQNSWDGHDTEEKYDRLRALYVKK